MFILYAIPIGLLAGLVLGGRLEDLGGLRLNWAPVALVALAVQLAIFGPLADVVGSAGPPIYVLSTLVVVIAVVRNIRVPGLAFIAIGAAANLAAILANGGVMPADPGALAMAGFRPQPGFSNSAVLEFPALRPLTDIFALPAGIPFANVFSVGDLLIGLGVAVAIAAAMRRRPPVTGDNSYH